MDVACCVRRYGNSVFIASEQRHYINAKFLARLCVLDVVLLAHVYVKTVTSPDSQHWFPIKCINASETKAKYHLLIRNVLSVSTWSSPDEPRVSAQSNKLFSKPKSFVFEQTTAHESLAKSKLISVVAFTAVDNISHSLSQSIYVMDTPAPSILSIVR